MLTVSYSGMTFSEIMGRPLNGCAISSGGFTGWWDRPTARSENTDRPGQHGSFIMPMYLTARMPSLTVFVHDDDSRVANHLVERITGLPAHGRLVVTDNAQTQWANAQLLSVDVSRKTRDSVRLVTIDWRCPDPRKYGELREFTSTGATVDLWHRGTADAIPEFKVTGFTGGYRIAGRGALAGNFFTVNGPKAAGTVDTVSFRSGMLLRNGEPVQRRILQNHVWTVPPGAGAQFRIEPIVAGQSGSCTALVTDTFV